MRGVLENLGPVWQQATLEEKNGLLASMLEAVYLDLAASKSVVGIVPKPPFYPLYESLLDESAGRVRVYKPNPESSQEGTAESPFGDDGGEGQEILNWWRRGEGGALPSHIILNLLGQRMALAARWGRM